MSWTRTSGRQLAIVAITALLAAGCGGGAGDVGARAELRAEMQSEGMTDDTIDCLFGAFDEAGLDIGELDSSSEPSPVAAMAVAGCMGDVFGDMFAQLGDEVANSFAEGFGEGDEGLSFDFGDSTDPAELDALADQCRNGDDAACDDLWLTSPIDSPEEQLAESCGGRSTEPRMGSCVLFAE